MKKNDEELEKLKNLMKENYDGIEPRLSKEEMWVRIEEKRSIKTYLSPKRIPMYVSSLFAIAASLYLVLSIPSVSERASNDNEMKVAKIEEKIEEIEVATTFLVAPESKIMTIKELLPYPAYLPGNFNKESEEYYEDNIIIHYGDGVGKIVLYKIYTIDTDSAFQPFNFTHTVVRDMGEYTLEIRGDVSLDELEKIADSMWVD